MPQIPSSNTTRSGAHALGGLASIWGGLANHPNSPANDIGAQLPLLAKTVVPLVTLGCGRCSRTWWRGSEAWRVQTCRGGLPASVPVYLGTGRARFCAFSLKYNIWMWQGWVGRQWVGARCGLWFAAYCNVEPLGRPRRALGGHIRPVGVQGDCMTKLGWSWGHWVPPMTGRTQAMGWAVRVYC